MDRNGERFAALSVKRHIKSMSATQTTVAYMLTGASIAAAIIRPTAAVQATETNTGKPKPYRAAPE